jgi:hypothetical protein
MSRRRRHLVGPVPLLRLIGAARSAERRCSHVASGAANLVGWAAADLMRNWALLGLGCRGRRPWTLDHRRHRRRSVLDE